MRRIKVLFLKLKGVGVRFDEEVEAAIGDRHDLVIYDPSKPMAPQFEAVEVVIDSGGSVGTHAMMDVAKDARLWQVHGTGLDHVDIEYMKSKGFMVSNCPGQFSSVALAECAMLFILMLTRRVYEAAGNFRQRVLYQPLGQDLGGLVLGIVGFGASGQELARRARAFGMRIRAVDVRSIEPEILEELKPEFMGTPADLDRLAAESDYLSLHLHLNKDTHHIIDARRLSLMKPTACIINVARGALVDEEAMYGALLQGRLGGAGLDVFAHEPPNPTLPVYQLPNVMVTPHIAGVTDGTARKRAAASAENVDRIAQGLPPLYRCDGGH